MRSRGCLGIGLLLFMCLYTIQKFTKQLKVYQFVKIALFPELFVHLKVYQVAFWLFLGNLFSQMQKFTSLFLTNLFIQLIVYQ